jgi:hypothetical protein
MAEEQGREKDAPMAGVAAATPSAQDLNRRRNDSLGRSAYDPFIADMKHIANYNYLDGNAQINSPQVSPDDDGIPGNSR